MKRLIDHYLLQWKTNPKKKPLLLRGARQVGKTYAARNLGKTFKDFVEINFELNEKAHTIFEGDLYPDRILRELSLLIKKPINPETTLIFFDEIQKFPKALTSLRYFYELMPQASLIAAGSLLDFAIEEVGVPVGRVESRYMYPLSFIEFFAAHKESLAIEEILSRNLHEPMSTVIHEILLKKVAEYLALGGMPEVIDCWIKTKQPLQCANYHSAIKDTYRQDFNKYAKEHQIKYLELLFKEIPRQLGTRFRYTALEGEYRKRDLQPALDLLETADIIHKVYRSSCQGFPFGAQIDPSDFKLIFLDVGLAQSILQLDLSQWFLNPLQEFVNKGTLVESFVGQEMLAYGNPTVENDLYYWHRETRTSQAEIDYVLQRGDKIVPIEVKAGTGKTLQSLNRFLEAHPQCDYSMRFSANNYSDYDKVHSYPLYAIAKVFADYDSTLKNAIEALIS